MKKIFSSLLIICLLLSLTTTVIAAGEPADPGLTRSWYCPYCYDQNIEQVIDYTYDSNSFCYQYIYVCLGCLARWSTSTVSHHWMSDGTCWNCGISR